MFLLPSILEGYFLFSGHSRFWFRKNRLVTWRSLLHFLPKKKRKIGRLRLRLMFWLVNWHFQKTKTFFAKVSWNIIHHLGFFSQFRLLTIGSFLILRVSDKHMQIICLKPVFRQSKLKLALSFLGKYQFCDKLNNFGPATVVILLSRFLSFALQIDTLSFQSI